MDSLKKSSEDYNKNRAGICKSVSADLVNLFNKLIKDENGWIYRELDEQIKQGKNRPYIMIQPMGTSKNYKYKSIYPSSNKILQLAKLLEDNQCDLNKETNGFVTYHCEPWYNSSSGYDHHKFHFDINRA